MDITGLGSAFDFAKGIMDRFFPKKATEAEKLEAINQIVPLIEGRDSAQLDAQKSIIVAEMAQGDNYTKRARPTVVYTGLAMIILVHVLIPGTINIVSVFKFGSLTVLQMAELAQLKELALPKEFWWAWTSVCGIWAIGRTAEKRGMSNKIIGMITGNKS